MKQGALLTRDATRFPRVDCAGFTLLELIVVLVIASIAASLVMPMGRSATARLAIDASAARFAAALRNARAESLRTSTDQTVTLDLESRSYWSDVEPSHRAFDRRIAVRLENETLEWAGPARRFRFRPDGSATGALVVMGDGHSQARIAVDWLTGAATLRTGRER